MVTAGENNMEFNEVIEKRKTSREWTDKEVDFEAIKRIIACRYESALMGSLPKLAVYRPP